MKLRIITTLYRTVFLHQWQTFLCLRNSEIIHSLKSGKAVFVTPCVSGEEYEGSPHFVISPDTLFFTSGGEVQFSPTGGAADNAASYIAPEQRQIPDYEGIDTEKVSVYIKLHTVIIIDHHAINIWGQSCYNALQILLKSNR